MILEFMFNRFFNYYYKNNLWNILLFLIGLIVILSIFRIGQKGSWSENFFTKDFFEEEKNKVTKKPKRRGDSKGEIECRTCIGEYF